MDRVIYKVQFFDYWHTGSGLAGSTYADSIVNKNAEGLPLIPGKTAKGLLREAAQELNRIDNTIISDDFILNVFGKKTDKDEEEVAALSFFSSLTLSEKLSQAIIDKKSQDALYHVISSTAINNDNGQASEGSLRQLEVTIPLTLYGVIENVPNNGNYETQLIHCFNWIKQLGLNRNRGLGRCQFSIVK